MFQRIILLSLLLASVCCTKTPAPTQDKPLLLVSVAPYLFLVERIAGPDFAIQSVVPAAANPHSFEPTARQVQSIGQGKIWFRIGEPFETKVLNVLGQRAPNLIVQDLRDGISLIEERHSLTCSGCSMDHQDRHIWLSPKLAAEQAALIEQTLSRAFPEKQELFKSNLSELCSQLHELDLEIGAILKPVQQRTILVSHPAFAYFCKDYNLQQLSIEYEGKDPRPRHLEEILRKVAEEQMRVTLALPQYNNKGAQMIAEKLHMQVRLVDPYSADYFTTMLTLAHSIADAN